VYQTPAVGGVEEVDAELVRAVHDHVRVGGRRQRAEVHRAEAKPADGQARPAQVRVLHAASVSRSRGGGQPARERRLDDRVRLIAENVHQIHTIFPLAALLAVISGRNDGGGLVLPSGHARSRVPGLVASRIGTAATLRAHDQRPSAERGRPF
jgi:hypothetical protein